MKYCIYFKKDDYEIIDILPKDLSGNIRAKIIGAWNNEISRKVLITLSMHESMTAPLIKEKIGHSMSTLHETIKRLQNDGLITTEMVYSKNKQKMIRPAVLCVTKNPKHKILIQKFFQGLWVDSKKTNKILEFLKTSPDKFFSPEQISSKTRIPVDEVELLLNNWDSRATRAVSSLLDPVPFEKKVLYRAKK